MKGLRVFSVLLLASFLATVRSQTQTIEFLSANTDPPGQGVRYDKEMTTVPSIAKRCNKICFNGMWAMYNTTSFGNANPSATTVYPALGYSLQSCSTSVGPIASKINSFRPLAVPTNVMPVPGMGTEFWKMPYFLGPNETALVPADPPTTKSFAINSFQMTTKAFVICNAAGICACCDTLNGHYLVPDIAAWPTKANPLGDMDTFTPVANSMAQTCIDALYKPLK